MKSTDIGIVVPTMGTRPGYLKQCLESIREAGDCIIHVVMPDSVSIPEDFADNLFDKVIDDPRQGLAAAIHVGLMSFPESVQFINWIGDDDLLMPDSLAKTATILREQSQVELVYGGCDYIDEDNRKIFTNRSGRFAVPLMRCGPQLVPQPGSLFRRETYISIGGLRSEYKWAFDLDLLIRLSMAGKTKFLRQVLASFRWHGDSLSVGGREGSVLEASAIRKAFLPKYLRKISEIWEFPLRKAINYAGTRVTRRRTISLN